MGIGVADDVALYLHVLHYEVGTVEGVSHDATYKCSCKNHGIRLLFVKECLNRILVGQVQFFVRASYKIVVSSFLEIIPYCRANESVVPGNIYFRIFI